jgi:hypothetical protein
LQSDDRAFGEHAGGVRTSLSMQFSFMVGVNEKHRVDFSFDQFVGNLEILVDGQPELKDFHMLSLSLTRRYEFTVGALIHHGFSLAQAFTPG